MARRPDRPPCRDGSARQLARWPLPPTATTRPGLRRGGDGNIRMAQYLDDDAPVATERLSTSGADQSGRRGQSVARSEPRTSPNATSRSHENTWSSLQTSGVGTGRFAHRPSGDNDAHFAFGERLRPRCVVGRRSGAAVEGLGSTPAPKWRRSFSYRPCSTPTRVSAFRRAACSFISSNSTCPRTASIVLCDSGARSLSIRATASSWLSRW